MALWEDPRPCPGPTISKFGLPFIISWLSPCWGEHNIFICIIIVHLKWYQRASMLTSQCKLYYNMYHYIRVQTPNIVPQPIYVYRSSVTVATGSVSLQMALSAVIFVQVYTSQTLFVFLALSIFFFFIYWTKYINNNNTVRLNLIFLFTRPTDAGSPPLIWHCTTVNDKLSSWTIAQHWDWTGVTLFNSWIVENWCTLYSISGSLCDYEGLNMPQFISQNNHFRVLKKRWAFIRFIRDNKYGRWKFGLNT